MKTLAEKSQSDSNTNDDIQGIKADEINQNFKAVCSSFFLLAIYSNLSLVANNLSKNWKEKPIL